MMFLLFIPIGILVDISEKIDKFKEHELSFTQILDYYSDFVWYYGYFLFPIFVFLSVIWFTSKLSNNSEITAILSSGISFNRFLRPYIISALIIFLFSAFSGMFIVPEKNKSFNEFQFKYLSKNKKDRNINKLYKQINENDFVYVSSYNPTRNQAYNFSYEVFEKNRLKVKNIVSQKFFLERMGIIERAKILEKKMTTKEKMDMSNTLVRLLHKKIMGELFKVIFAYKSKQNNFLGFN